MKKFIPVFFAFFSLIPTSIWAEDYTDENGVKYTYTPVTEGTGTATVSECTDAATVTIPNVIAISERSYTVTAIAANAFSNCVNMATLNILCTNLPSMADDTFNNVKTGLNITFKGIKYTHRGTWNNGDSFKVTGVSDNTYGSFEILDAINHINVTEIGENAFANLPNKTVSISKNINTISSKAFINFTDGNINNANRLISITVDINNSKYSSYNGVLYSRYNQGTEEVIELVTCPVKNDYSDIWRSDVTAIGDNAFICHRNLENITIPATVKTIGESAFNLAGADQTSLTISFEANSNLSTIGRSAFQRSSVATLYLPAGLKEIKEFAFQECLKLATITFPTSFEKLGNGAFLGCKTLSNITFSGTSLRTISTKAFYNCLLSTPLTIPNGVTSIQDNAFNVGDSFNSNLSHLPSVVRIPSSVTSIAETAFPDGVTKQHQLNLAFEPTEEWATYYSIDEMELPTGIEAWAVTGFDPDDDTKLLTEQLHYIHKEEAILLHWTEGANGRNNFWCSAPSAAAKTDDTGRNSNAAIFKGSVAGIPNLSTLSGDKYVLSGDQFVKANQGALPAFRCYIVRENANDPTDHLYFKNNGENCNHTFIFKEDGTLIKYDVFKGSAKLETVAENKVQLTITPGANYYAYYDEENFKDSTKSDITVRRNVTAVSGRAAPIGLDNTFYQLTPGEDSSQDKRGAIVYTFDPGKATVFEVTVNFHKRTNFQDANTKPKVNLQPGIKYSYDGTAHKPDVISVTYGDNETVVDPRNYDIVYTDSINAGQGKVIIKGKRKFMSEFHGEYTIERRSIENIHTNVIADQTYTGNEIKPDLGINDGNIPITERTDYDLDWDNNTDVNTSGDEGNNAKVSIIAKEGNYTGTKVIFFKIQPKDLSTEENKATITIPIQDYTGSAIEPTDKILVKDGNKTLTHGKDYDVEFPYDDNIEAGEGVATTRITFRGNYKGTLDEKFTIVDHGLPKNVTVSYDSENEWTTYYAAENLNLTDVADELEAYIVTGIEGRKVNAEKSVSMNSVPFIPKNTAVLLHRINGSKNLSFDVKTCSGEKLPVTIVPDNRFKGTSVKIDISTISGYKFILLNGKFIQTTEDTLSANRCYIVIPKPIDGVSTLTIGRSSDGIIYMEGDKENNAIGTASKSEPKDGKITLTVKPNKGYYVEDVKVIRAANATTARAAQIDIDNSEIEVTPEDTIDNTGFTATYTYTYPHKRSYDYQVTVFFKKSTNLPSEKPTITLDPDSYEYDKSEKKPKVTVKIGETTLTEKIDYVLQYKDNVVANAEKETKANVLINGIRKYTNEVNKEFKIEKRNINHIKIKVGDSLVYTGNPIEPLIITDSVNHTNIIDTDEYTITYSPEDHTNAGTVKATIEGKNNYTGKKEVSYEIMRKELNVDNITIAPFGELYENGDSIKPDLDIKFGATKLIAQKDYKVTYENNVKDGTAKAIINFIGNYTGRVDTTFIIKHVPESVPLNISFVDGNKWTTFCWNDNVSIPEGLEAYIITELNGKEITPKKVEFIPENIPVLLYHADTLKTGPFVGNTMPSDTQLSEDIKPYSGFHGTMKDTVITTIPGSKFILLNDKFIQAVEGTLPANRCYINATIDGIAALTIGKEIDERIYLVKGKPSTFSGIATTSTPSEDGLITLTVTPNPNYYVEKENITIVSYAKAGDARAQKVEVDDSKVEITADDANVDPSGITKYTFKYTKGYHYQIIVDFQECTNFAIKENQPTVLLDKTSYVYDGIKKEPKATVILDDKTLVEKTDYVVSYNNNINAGTAQVVIKGKGYFSGEYGGTTFNITRRTINSDQVKVEFKEKSFTYCGKAIVPEFTITDYIIVGEDTINIITTDDYKISKKENNTHVSTKEAKAMIALEGIRNYKDFKDIYFEIQPKELTIDNVQTVPDTVYTGVPIEPELTIMDGNLEVPKTDYDAEYIDCLYPGTATINITFKGDYKGTVSTTFNIKEKVYTRTLNIEYDEQAEWTTFIWHENLTLPESLKAFVVTAFDTKTKKISTEPVPFIPRNIGILLQRTNKETTTYQGNTLPADTMLDKTIKPNTDVFLGSLTDLELGNIEGIKFVLVNDKFVQTGQGLLKANRCYIHINGETDGLDDIDPDKGLDDCIIKSEGKVNAKAGTAKTDIVNGGKVCQLTVTPAEGYFVTAENITIIRCIDAGKGRAPSIDDSKDIQITAVNSKADPCKETEYTFPFDDNYSYQIIVDFQKRIDISKSEANITITFDTPNLEYNGKAQKVKNIVVKSGDTTFDSSNYEVSYEDNINAGPSYVVITGSRSFIGSKKEEFIIQQRNIKNVTVMDIPDQEYTGAPIEPALIIKDIIEEGGESIIDESQYDLVFENNTEIGKAKVNIVAKKINYHNTKVAYFNIIPATGIQQISVEELEGQWFDLNGQRILNRPTQKGVYILRDKNGKTQKVRIK